MRSSPALALLSALSLTAPAAAWAADPVHVAYRTYAVGLHVADVEATFGIGQWSYQVSLAYHTTGLVGAFFRGHQDNSVYGSWGKVHPVPRQFTGTGVWRGEERTALIDYDKGLPVIRQLVPPNEAEREPVPEDLQANSIDTLSALADLIRIVARTGRCETTVHTYDGRRATEIEAHTVGPETLEASSRSPFDGSALRCDFVGRMLAGFKFDDDGTTAFKPLHGSAWLADIVPGGPPIPVRVAFETRWFGDAVAYLDTINTDTAAATSPSPDGG